MATILHLRPPEPELEATRWQKVLRYFSDWLPNALKKFEPEKTYHEVGRHYKEPMDCFDIRYIVYPARVSFAVHLAPLVDPVLIGFVTADGASSFEHELNFEDRLFNRLKAIAKEKLCEKPDYPDY